MCALIVSAKAFAQPQTPPPSADATPTPVPNQYNDPAMSFTAPADFYQIPLLPHDPAHFDQPTLVAAWIRDAGKAEQLTIAITMEDYDGSLDGFEMVTENELRDKADLVFFKKREVTQLSNGMPAYWQEVSIGTGFDEVKRFNYAWIDGVRGIILAVTGRYGGVDEPTAKKALADASGVLYPKGRL
jgi:hypothetical protein